MGKLAAIQRGPKRPRPGGAKPGTKPGTGPGAKPGTGPSQPGHPAPSFNLQASAAINLVLAEIVLQIGTVLLRKLVERLVLQEDGGAGARPRKAGKRTLPQKLAIAALTRLGGTSMPAAVLVSIGLVGVSLYQRGRAERAVHNRERLHRAQLSLPDRELPTSKGRRKPTNDLG